VNSTVATVDQNGALKGSFLYEPFGQVTSTGSTYPFQYTGREAVSSNLDYFRARFYNPAAGRFISEDPSGFSNGDFNLYSYAGDDPISNVDPGGLDYWVEGSGPGQGGLGFHQKVCVGRGPSDAGRLCISFFDVDGSGCLQNCNGQILQDAVLGGQVVSGMYRHTSAKVDAKIRLAFFRLIGTNGSYFLVGNNCRNFSQSIFNLLVGTYGGQPGP
jgi:RHS repeat-associated protein